MNEFWKWFEEKHPELLMRMKDFLCGVKIKGDNLFMSLEPEFVTGWMIKYLIEKKVCISYPDERGIKYYNDYLKRKIEELDGE